MATKEHTFDGCMTVNGLHIALTIIFLVLCIFQGIVIGQMVRLNDESQQYIDYWRNKTDSLSDENFKLYMKVYDLKDSIITLTFQTQHVE